MAASRSDNFSGTVNTITDDIPQTIHAELNADANFWKALSLDSCAVQLLFYVMTSSAEAYSSTNSPIIFLSQTALRNLLKSNPEVSDLLSEAHESGDYTEIRRRRE